MHPATPASRLALLLALVAGRQVLAAEAVVVTGRVATGDGFAARTVTLRDGRITSVAAAEGASAAALDVLLPGFVDSHVHVMLLQDPSELLRGGLAAAVDMGAPDGVFPLIPRLAPLRLTVAGQVLTAPGGYPTRSMWGRDGYGLEVAGSTAARDAVRAAHAKGARVVKIALAAGQGPMLSKAERAAILAEAHALGMKVGAHALSVEGFAAALDPPIDLLVHAPVERIDDASLRRFCGRAGAAVIPTLRAFGARAEARDNVRRMRACGCQVLYGTDVPNNVAPGIDVAELELLVALGMTPAEVIDAATTAPARYFGLEGAGAIEVGATGVLLAVPGDPYRDVAALRDRRVVGLRE